MGREVRRVPPKWRHPDVDYYDARGNRGGYQPMYDESCQFSWDRDQAEKFVRSGN